MAENSCSECIHWGPDSGFSEDYKEDLKFCIKWWRVNDGPVMKISYGSGKGSIFTYADFSCKYFKDKKECPADACSDCDDMWSPCEEGCF